jgi:beta-lactamase superfamily II metal-dependent hydrolase
MFTGLEVDVLSLGDADCIIVTQWNGGFPHRILIDGGCASDAGAILEFLRQRSYSNFWAVLCTHLHNDHASGLIKLVRSNSISFSKGLMHDITKHVSAESLRRASAADDGVKQVVESTKELAGAFASRGITPLEPFAGMAIAAWPETSVLGPSLSFYRETIEEFTKVEVPVPTPTFAPSPLWRAAGMSLGGNPTLASLSALGRISSPGSIAPLPPLTGTLSKSSVKKNPKTQPYNNTSTILGIKLGAAKILLTGDAGSDALSHIGPEWHDLTYLGVPHHGSDGNLSRFDIERFRPKFAGISAKGDSCHPDRAIVSGLVKVGAKVGSTHEHGHLWFYTGIVPARKDYGQIEGLKGTGSPEPITPWLPRIGK